ncbi:plasmid partitioning protein RepB C-terminal domain-containing protein [Rhodobacter capsulatus]|uniref:plasmid partitioning protein RepB C-terminal domain-containing protein n=1 Tax=Rhodobacter capsulatus TaxID=1061 RepID=UPI004026F806
MSKTAKSSRKYRQIAASIAEIGLVEPPVVARNPDAADTWLLLDGHMRIEMLKDSGAQEVECLISTDDEAFTYNRQISRLAPIQEHKMILKAIERGVPEERIASALDLSPRSIMRKARLLDGICEEAVAILKDKPCTAAVFDTLRKMKTEPPRVYRRAKLSETCPLWNRNRRRPRSLIPRNSANARFGFSWNTAPNIGAKLRR